MSESTTQLLHRLKTAVVRRNPSIAPAMTPPRTLDDVRAALKRVGINGNLKAVVELYSWHDGAFPKQDSEAEHLGIAPPVVIQLPKSQIEFLEGLGVKVDPSKKVYNAFNFFRLEAAVHWLKLFKKFAKSDPRYAAIAGRLVPIMSNNTGDHLAIDVTADSNNRVLLLSKDFEVREAYSSFQAFVEDLICANEQNKLLTCVQSPGEVLQLTPLVKAKTPPPTAPPVEGFPVVRTDFSNDAAWQTLQGKLQDGTDVDLLFVSDDALKGARVDDLRSRFSSYGVAFVVDEATLSNEEYPLLVVDFSKKKLREFRVIPEALNDVACNLAVGNMDFKEFAAAVGTDRIFRGFDT